MKDSPVVKAVRPMEGAQEMPSRIVLVYVLDLDTCNRGFEAERRFGPLLQAAIR
jgi:hypothetical protein